MDGCELGSEDGSVGVTAEDLLDGSEVNLWRRAEVLRARKGLINFGA